MDCVPVAELTGFAEMGQWCPLGDYEILIEPTKRTRRVRIRLKPKPSRTGKVRVVKRTPHGGRKLTDGGASM